MLNHITPDDPRITYSGYVQKEVDSTRARFPRLYADNLLGFRDSAYQSPGTSVRWRTNAEHVVVVLQYLGTENHCSESCAIRTDNGQCYSAQCHAQCSVLLYVDGELQEHPASRAFVVVCVFRLN